MTVAPVECGEQDFLLLYRVGIKFVHIGFKSSDDVDEKFILPKKAACFFGG